MSKPNRANKLWIEDRKENMFWQFLSMTFAIIIIVVLD